MIDEMLLGIYKHYKGNLYKVHSIARHTESGEELVIYSSLYGDYGTWARPKTMFKEKLMHQDQLVDRFTFIRNPDIIAPERNSSLPIIKSKDNSSLPIIKPEDNSQVYVEKILLSVLGFCAAYIVFDSIIN